MDIRESLVKRDAATICQMRGSRARKSRLCTDIPKCTMHSQDHTRKAASSVLIKHFTAINLGHWPQSPPLWMDIEEACDFTAQSD